jgi:hypothetical protein
MKTYPQQHEPWRPDYPPVICDFVSGETVDCSSRCFMVFEPLTSKNIKAFTTARNAINKAMKQ